MDPSEACMWEPDTQLPSQQLREFVLTSQHRPALTVQIPRRNVRGKDCYLFTEAELHCYFVVVFIVK